MAKDKGLMIIMTSGFKYVILKIFNSILMIYYYEYILLEFFNCSLKLFDMINWHILVICIIKNFDIQ